MHPVIRLERIELFDFKNIKHGTIEWNNYRNKLFYTHQSDIIGIYGQNGSGKTAVVEAMRLLKHLIGGYSLPKDAYCYINKDAKEAVLKFVFYMEMNDKQIVASERYLIFYEFNLGAIPFLNNSKENQPIVTKERLSYIKIGQRAKTDLLCYQFQEEELVVKPKVRYQELLKKNVETKNCLIQARQIAVNEAKSFLFQDVVIELFHDNSFNTDYYSILKRLSYYAQMNLFVIANRNEESEVIRFLPISFHITMEHCVSSGEMSIPLVGSSFISSSGYELARCVLLQLNQVVRSILPGICIELVELSEQTDNDGTKLKCVELYTIRDGNKIPMKYESEGIKKIISILSTLISVYNDAGICLVVDELDAGIFEYLLGELLSILEKGGKGQLIFTSHNLRALEKLHKDSIIVSTTNPLKRFIRIPHDKNNRNYRNSYLRSIDLGGLDESIYEETNSYEIAYAFKKAGEIFEAE